MKKKFFIIFFHFFPYVDSSKDRSECLNEYERERERESVCGKRESGDKK